VAQSHAESWGLRARGCRRGAGQTTVRSPASPIQTGRRSSAHSPSRPQRPRQTRTEGVSIRRPQRPLSPRLCFELQASASTKNRQSRRPQTERSRLPLSVGCSIAAQSAPSFTTSIFPKGQSLVGAETKPGGRSLRSYRWRPCAQLIGDVGSHRAAEVGRVLRHEGDHQSPDEPRATTMIDRLIRHSEILSLKGDSYRLRGKQDARPGRPAS
jgi:IstB-like ATP binding protein